MENAKRPRLKRLKRALAGDLPGLVITERDIQILSLVYTFRAVTTDQIRRIVFHTDGKSTQCDLRLKLLFQHGFLERRSQTVLYEKNKPLIYLLTEKGAKHLAEVSGGKRTEILWHPKHNQISTQRLQHLLQVNQVRASIEQAAEECAYTLNWLDEFTIRRLKLYDSFPIQYPSGITTKTTLIPDAFFTLDTPTMWLSCFLEVDRGTESLRTVSEKLCKYLAYLTTDGYQERYGVQDEEGNKIYPCVLTITTTQERLDNLRAVSKDVGAGDIFLFSTFSAVTYPQVFLRPIWWKPTSNEQIALVA